MAKGAKTVWQLAYAGSVGSQVLVGLPVLLHLRETTGARVWPFDTGLATPDAQTVIAEIYPGLLQAEAKAEKREHEPLDAAQVRVVARALAALDATDDLAALFSPALEEADRQTVETEEGWILGLGFEHKLRAAAARPQPGQSREAPAPPASEGSSLFQDRRPRRMIRYEKSPSEIYRKSFETVRAEARLDRFPPAMVPVVIRLIHACGMVEIADRLAFSPNAAEAGIAALADGAPIFCDCEMVASGIIRRALPAQNEVICTLNDPATPSLAASIGNTRSAAAVELWADRLEGAVVAIGNAPTALFHLLELLDEGAPRPALILGFPVGFVGAAESKAELAARPRGADFIALRGRKGGSAMASAAVNALAAGLGAEGPA